MSTGLALSGGGSRAAAFHCGTLDALDDLSLLDQIDVGSCVSGGSVFGAAWALSLARGTKTKQFLDDMRRELTRGFVARTIRPRLLKTLVPFLGYSRTDALATTFDDAFFDGATLADLPARPDLLLNTAILENGRVAQFSRAGFSTWEIQRSSSAPSDPITLTDFPLSLAVAASCAFPFVLPPVRLTRRKLRATDVEEFETVHLTDGGVIEDLGVQTLLRAPVRAWDLVVSDANAPLPAWRSGFIGFFLGFWAWLLSDGTLPRVMLMMNDKQNKWARKNALDALELSILSDGSRRSVPALRAYLATLPDDPPRRVLLAKLQTTLDRFIEHISPVRLFQLAEQAKCDVPARGDTPGVVKLLEAAGVNLDRARAEYAKLGGDAGARRAAAIETNFTGLSDEDRDALEKHAAWQIHAAHAVYGFEARVAPRVQQQNV